MTDEIAAWAEVVEDLLHRVDPGQRQAVLELALRKEVAARKVREENSGILCQRASDIDWNTPGLRYWNEIMRLKSQVICAFVRDITNNHSKEDAARILFADHYGVCPGSGWLVDYLDGLPAVKVDIRKVTKLSDPA